MRVLVLNPGSSSLKASVVEPGTGEALARLTVSLGEDASRAADLPGKLRDAVGRLETSGVDPASIEAVGHRVVHGGTRFRAPVRVDDEVLAGIAELRELAPLHTGGSLDAIRAALDAFANLPQVAAFDTAFHADLAESAFRYPVPYEWYARWGVRRFGFHGLSVRWSVDQAGELLGRPASELNLLVARLGSGCSVTAVAGGKSAGTTMGFTPLEGVMMGTRSGSIDPAIVFYLLRRGVLDARGLEDALEHGSGLLGVSGSTADVRRLLELARDGDDRAALAIALFVRSAAAGIAAMASCLPRLDALIFTGGIGERSAEIRRRIAERLTVLSIEAPAVADVDTDSVVSAFGARVAVLRIEAREDIVVARQTAAVIASGSPVDES